MNRQIIHTTKAPKPVGPYSQAVQAGGFLYISGQIPINAQTGEVVSNSFEEQTRCVLENVRSIAEAAGGSLENIVKVNIFMTDIDQFGAFNSVYEEYFSKSKPARACVEVSKLPKAANLEVEAVAYLPRH